MTALLVDTPRRNSRTGVSLDETTREKPDKRAIQIQMKLDCVVWPFVPRAPTLSTCLSSIVLFLFYILSYTVQMREWLPWLQTHPILPVFADAIDRPNMISSAAASAIAAAVAATPTAAVAAAGNDRCTRDTLRYFRG